MALAALTRDSYDGEEPVWINPVNVVAVFSDEDGDGGSVLLTTAAHDSGAYSINVKESVSEVISRLDRASAESVT